MALEPERTLDGQNDAPDKDNRADRLGFVAHEVRNPLSTALWTAELLARASPSERGGARGEKLSGMMLRALGRVRQILEDHFLSERLDLSGIPLRIEPIDMREVVEAAVARKPSDVGVVTANLEGDLKVQGDRQLVERALEALLGAAGRDGAALVVTAQKTAERVVVQVVGGPLREDALSDPAKGAPSDQKGRALSLPLARRIAVALGGALELAGGGLELALPTAPEGALSPGSP